MQLKDASILVVDDEPLLQDILGNWFDRVAGHVDLAANGIQALEVLARNKIDLIVSDVRMPVMDGITLLKEIKTRGLHTPRVILLSGFTDVEAGEAYDLGVEALLDKPVARQDLIDAAQRSLTDRDERWKTASDPAANTATLVASFASLTAALQEHQIAFGRGGFCIAIRQPMAVGPINITLDFQADRFVLSGQGIVRWQSRGNAGIELTHVAEESLSRVLELTGRSVSYIPSALSTEFAASGLRAVP